MWQGKHYTLHSLVCRSPFSIISHWDEGFPDPLRDSLNFGQNLVLLEHVDMVTKTWVTIFCATVLLHKPYAYLLPERRLSGKGRARAFPRAWRVILKNWSTRINGKWVELQYKAVIRDVPHFFYDFCLISSDEPAYRTLVSPPPSFHFCPIYPF